jgi:hypothetical protein
MNWYKKASSYQEVLEKRPDLLSFLSGISPAIKGFIIAQLIKYPNTPKQELEKLVQEKSQVQQKKLSLESQKLLENYKAHPLFKYVEKWLNKSEKTYFSFFSNIQQINHIRDFVEMESRENQKLREQILDIEPSDLLNKANEWTNKVQGEKEDQERINKLEYFPIDSLKGASLDMKFQDGKYIVKLKSSADCVIEGKLMNHCVGNYGKDVEEGKIDVYSLRDQQNKPLVTIGIQYEEVVVQLKGERDIDPSEYKEYIKLWLQHHNEIQYYSDEPYAKNGYNLKDLLKIDIEKSEKWKKKINNIIEQGKVIPSFAYYYCTNILESGKAPESWLNGISKFIEIYGNAPSFAENYCKNILESGKAPESWLNAISKYVEKYGGPSSFAYNYCTKILESGKAPESWLNAINKYVEEYREAPYFARNYCKNILESGKAPESWLNGISKFVEKYGNSPYFAYDYCKNILESGKAPESWLNAISKVIEKDGYAPSFARNWYYNSGKEIIEQMKREGKL